MQVDCYKRNFHSTVCVHKCPFRPECEMNWMKEHRKKEEAKTHVANNPQIVWIDGKPYTLAPV